MQTNILGRRVLACAAVLTLLPCCGDPKSSSTSGAGGGAVPTAKMTMDLRVESSDPDVAVVRTNLNDGRVLGNSYRLDGGDYLRACVNGVCRNMADNDSVTSPDYIARFDYQPGVDFVVAFNRREASSAPDSRVSLPAPFSIVTPANRQQVTDGETVLVSWSPSGAPANVSLVYDSDCKLESGAHVIGTGTLSTDSDANGSEPVSIDSIVNDARASATSVITRCSIDVTVRHQLEGRVDPGFERGTAFGIVSRQVNLVYLPR
jgi:hypothetical protein